MLTVLLASFAASALAAPCQPAAFPNDDLVLVTFANQTNTTYKWWEQNDPVMGGQSYGNFSVVEASCGDAYGKFQGEVKIVPFLKAPGFCRATTGSIIIADAADFLSGGLELTVRSPSQVAEPFKGFKLAFSAVGTPHHHGGHEVTGMFKADFVLPAATEPTDWQFVKIPFAQFSWDWSDATGECSTKDSDGFQHQCCTAATPKFCPTAKQLSLIDGFSIWAEGTAGVFDLEVFMIAATKNGGSATDPSAPGPAIEQIIDPAPVVLGNQTHPDNCEMIPWAFCCKAGTPCDCTKGIAVPGQCVKDSYLFCCAVGTTCDCSSPP